MDETDQQVLVDDRNVETKHEEPAQDSTDQPKDDDSWTTEHSLVEAAEHPNSDSIRYVCHSLSLSQFKEKLFDAPH